jgi:hypothetical protein
MGAVVWLVLDEPNQLFLYGTHGSLFYSAATPLCCATAPPRPPNTALSCKGRGSLGIADLVSFNALLARASDDAGPCAGAVWTCGRDEALQQ